MSHLVKHIVGERGGSLNTTTKVVLRFLKKNWEGIVKKVKSRLSRRDRLVPKVSYRGQSLVIDNLAALFLWFKLACMYPPPKLLGLMDIQALFVVFIGDGLHWIPQSYWATHYFIMDYSKSVQILYRHLWQVYSHTVLGSGLHSNSNTTAAGRDCRNTIGQGSSWAGDMAVCLRLQSMCVS